MTGTAGRPEALAMRSPMVASLWEHRTQAKLRRLTEPVNKTRGYTGCIFRTVPSCAKVMIYYFAKMLWPCFGDAKAQRTSKAKAALFRNVPNGSGSQPN